jgi:hypothetical protein
MGTTQSTSNSTPIHTETLPKTPPQFKYDWELEIQYNPRELGETVHYELYFFLGPGPVPSKPELWRQASSRLFEPITSQAQTTTTEFRDMNGYLERHCEGKLKDDDVIPYLRKHLSWRAKKVRALDDY